MTSQNWKERFDEKFPHILAAGTGIPSVELKSFFSQERTLLLEELAGDLRQKYESKSKEKVVKVMASPSLSHSNQRRQGFLSGLLVAEDIIKNKINDKSL